MTMRKGGELPELLAEIAEAAGMSTALAIAQHRGGTRVHFPAKVSDEHWLPVLVGREAADKLCKHFTVNHTGGVTVEIPLGPQRIYEAIRLRALAMVDEGASVREVARALGVTMRSIDNWKAARKGNLTSKARRARQQQIGRAVQNVSPVLLGRKGEDTPR